MLNRQPELPLTKPKSPAQRLRQLPIHRLQGLAIVGALMLPLLLLVGWAVVTDQRDWNDWLSKLKSATLSFGRRVNTDPQFANRAKLGRPLTFHGSGYADLGQFSIGRFDPVTRTTLTVSFQLEGMTVFGSNESFQQFMDANQRSFREQVVVTVRDCETSDLSNSRSLGRKLVARINRVLGERVLESVDFQDFEVYESIGKYPSAPWEPSAADTP